MYGSSKCICNLAQDDSLSSCFESHFGKILKPKKDSLVRWLFSGIHREMGLPVSRAGCSLHPGWLLSGGHTKTLTRSSDFLSRETRIWVCTHILVFKTLCRHNRAQQRPYIAARVSLIMNPIALKCYNPSIGQRVISRLERRASDQLVINYASSRV